jgi:hypothetical protein
MGLDLATLAQAFGTGVGGYLQGRTEKKRYETEQAERKSEREREQARYEDERQRQTERDAVAAASAESLNRARNAEQERYETERAEKVAARGSRARALEEAVMRGAANEQERAQIAADLSKLPDDEAGVAYLEQALERQKEGRTQRHQMGMTTARATADEPTRQERIMAHAQRLAQSGEMTPEEAYEEAVALYDQQDLQAAVRAVRAKIASGAPLSPQEKRVADEMGLLPPEGIPDAFQQAIVNLRTPPR